MRIHLVAAKLAVLGLALLPRLAAPIPLLDYDGVPPHAGHVSWSAPDPASTDANPKHFHHHHFHDEPLNVRVLDDARPDTDHKGAEELSGKRKEPHYDAYSVWVNEGYKVFGSVKPDGTPVPGSSEFFSHGYIIQDKDKPTPEYKFIGIDDPGLVRDPDSEEPFLGPKCTQPTGFCLWDSSNPALGFDPRPTVRRAFEIWSGVESDDAHLTTGLRFRERDGEDEEEIRVEFVNYIEPTEVGRVALGQWNPATKVLRFARFEDDANRTKIKWYIGADKDGLRLDFKDFLTVALHEVGHIVGLDHQSDKDDVMYVHAGIGSEILGLGRATFRELSYDDKLGALDLYSIPCQTTPAPAPAPRRLFAADEPADECSISIPAPPPAALIASGLGILLMLRRRARYQRASS